MPSDNWLAVIAAGICALLAVTLIYRLLRYIVRREVRRAITSLRQAKFALVTRDRKGRFAK